MSDKIKVVELFAGVGGFRLGLEGWRGKFKNQKLHLLIESKDKKKPYKHF
jgi:DNA (cytosine-5)-methyltransferase 1